MKAVLLKFVVFATVAPKVGKTVLPDVRVRVGQTFYLDVPYVGEPMPDIVWSLDGKPILADKRVTVKNTESESVLNNLKSHREDSGTYTLTLSNDSGQDKVSCNVVVLGASSNIVLTCY